MYPCRQSPCALDMICSPILFLEPLARSVWTSCGCPTRPNRNAASRPRTPGIALVGTLESFPMRAAVVRTSGRIGHPQVFSLAWGRPPSQELSPNSSILPPWRRGGIGVKSRGLEFQSGPRFDAFSRVSRWRSTLPQVPLAERDLGQRGSPRNWLGRETGHNVGWTRPQSGHNAEMAPGPGAAGGTYLRARKKPPEFPRAFSANCSLSWFRAVTKPRAARGSVLRSYLARQASQSGPAHWFSMGASD